MRILINWILNALIIIVAAYVLPGIFVDGIVPALMVALVLGVLNAIAKPIFILLTLPVTILTFGLFILIINTVLIYMTSGMVPGFEVSGFWSAFLFGIVLSVLNYITHRLFR